MKTLSLFLWLGLAPVAVAAPQDLEIVFFDVGQGDATLIISPTGETCLIDGGLVGKGTNIILPELAARGISYLDYVIATHYHNDHIGGLAELVTGGIVIDTCFDRGDVNAPPTQEFLDYSSTFAAVREVLDPGDRIDLGSEVVLRTIIVNGELSNGLSVVIGGTAQEENSASIGLRIDYRDFSLFVGGDLTNESATSANVEDPVGEICSDVDVYRVNHHGAGISSGQIFLNRLQPEFAIVSAGSPNAFHFPRQEVINRLNKADRVIPVWCTSQGNGAHGYVSAEGHITLYTNGFEYTVRANDGGGFTSLVDESGSLPIEPGELVVSEFLKDPVSSSDTYGEWVELASTRPEPLDLRGIEVTDLLGSFRIEAPIKLLQGHEVVLGAGGLPMRNGGHTPALVYPLQSFTMPNGSGNVAVAANSVTLIDRVTYKSFWPGGSGISTERIDLLGDPLQANFAEGSAPFGTGDLGTPSLTNSSDNTNFNIGGDSWTEVVGQPSADGDLNLIWHMPGETGAAFKAFLCYGTRPGTTVWGTHIPAMPDPLYQQTKTEAGWSGTVPASEQVAGLINIGNDPALVGRLFYCQLITYNPLSKVIRTIAVPIPQLIAP